VSLGGEICKKYSLTEGISKRENKLPLRIAVNGGGDKLLAGACSDNLGGKKKRPEKRKTTGEVTEHKTQAGNSTGIIRFLQKRVQFFRNERGEAAKTIVF